MRQFSSLFSDVDDANHELSRDMALALLEQTEYPPTLIVDSGHGLQPYWLLTEPCNDAGRIEKARKAIQSITASDNVADAARVMRLAGSHNCKQGNGEWLSVDIVSHNPERRYRLDDLEPWLERAPVIIPRKLEAPKPKPKHDGAARHFYDDVHDLAVVRDALKYIPNDDREIWRNVGMSLNDAYGDAGREVWTEWSASSAKYDAADQDKNWRSFTPGGGITIGTLFHLAQQHGYDFPDTDHRTKRANGPTAQHDDRPFGEIPTAPKAPHPDSSLEVFDAGDDTDLPPPRGWLLGNQFCRSFLSSLVAPGAAGKTALRVLQLLALAVARNLTSQHVFMRCRVLLLSFEDGRDELRRRVLAALLHHKVNRNELKGWFYYATPKGIKLAELKDGSRQRGQLEQWLRDKIEQLKPDIVCLDPFVKTHALGENDNSAMDFVCELLATFADDYNIAVDSPHHARKGVATPGDADIGRGGSSNRDAGRLVYTLTAMSEEEAKQFNIEQTDRRFYVRLDSAKVNIVPSRSATWFKLVGVNIGNTTELYPNGDEVQTVEPWNPPKLWEGLAAEMLNAALTEIDAGMPNGQRFSSAGPARDRAAWRVVQKHCQDRTEAQCREIIRIWLKNGVLYEAEYDDPVDRRKRSGLRLDTTKRPS